MTDSKLSLLDRLQAPAYTFVDGKKTLDEQKDGQDRMDAVEEIKRLTAEVERLTAEVRVLEAEKDAQTEE